METKVILKGGLVFVITFALFAIAKPKEIAPPTSAVTPTLATLPVSEQPVAVQTTEDTTVAPIQRVEPTEVPAEADAVNPVAAQPARCESESVGALLQRWTKAIQDNDIQEESACYADTVENYYGRVNVDKPSVQEDKQAFISGGNRVMSFTLDNVKIESTSTDAETVLLDKDITWQTANSSTHRLIHSRLSLASIAGDWKITGEQDFR